MLDLTKPSDRSYGYINKLSIRRDGTAENKLLFDLDLAFMVADDDEAKIVDKLIPGAFPMYLRTADGDEDLKTSVRVNPSAEDLAVSLVRAVPHKEVDISQLFEGRACVRNIVYNAVPGAASATFRIRLFDVNVKSAGALCEALGLKIIFGFAKQQQLLSFPSPVSKPSTANGPVVTEDIKDLLMDEEPWTIVSGKNDSGKWVFGRLLYTDESVQDCEPTVLIDNFGNEVSIKESGIISRFDISAKGQLISMIDAYQAKIKNLGDIPTWEYMILAMGQVAFETIKNGSNPCEITWEVINLALQYSKTKSAS